MPLLGQQPQKNDDCCNNNSMKTQSQVSDKAFENTNTQQQVLKKGPARRQSVAKEVQVRRVQ
jgi:hypothetical protein